jgi:hypothetical protein
MEDRHNNFVNLFAGDKKNTTLFVHISFLCAHNLFLCYTSLSFSFFFVLSLHVHQVVLLSILCIVEKMKAILNS